MVAVYSVDVLFHRLVALCLAENNDQRYNSIVHIVIVLCLSLDVSASSFNVKTEPLFVLPFVCVCLCSCEQESVRKLLRKWIVERQDGREIVRKSRPICEKELSPLRRSVRICLQASFTPSFVNTFPLLSPLPVQPLNTQVFCCCTLPIFKLYGNVCLRCYPKDNTLLLVWHSKDRGWHTPEKNQLTGNLDIMKSSDFIPNAT